MMYPRSRLKPILRDDDLCVDSEKFLIRYVRSEGDYI